MILLSALVLTGCGSGDDNGAQADASQVGGEVGNQAPDFTLPRVNGADSLTLSSLKGKVVLVDFWDTWCPPCREALPHLQELSLAYSEDLVVVGLALGQEGDAKVKAFTEKHGLTFEMVVWDKDQKLIDSFGGIEAIPTTFLIDADGVIQKKWEGATTKAGYEAAIKKVIGS
jgi:peroxiredoxin